MFIKLIILILLLYSIIGALLYFISWFSTDTDYNYKDMFNYILYWPKLFTGGD